VGRQHVPNLPIIVSENGVNSADDALRPRYMALHIHQMWRAVNFNWRSRVTSTVTGGQLRMGPRLDAPLRALGLDVETQKRIRRPL